ncbi:hypothetical protein Cni_G11153 [Canna indica]|uniref:RNase H type-1 domain-containing protein n=1 Tax=Canna indica TaxID=4628 RepID=A0AAQ3K790_9LILI|nr:hypothetical protein Cni_G11153 [Canna indica]
MTCQKGLTGQGYGKVKTVRIISSLMALLLRTSRILLLKHWDANLPILEIGKMVFGWMKALTLRRTLSSADTRGAKSKNKQVPILKQVGRTAIYCDAAWVESSGKAGIGVWIKNCNGETIAEQNSCKNMSSALAAEILAIWSGVQLAKKLKITNAFIYSDCLKAINFLNKTLQTPWYLNDLIRDIWLIAWEVKILDWCHLKREGNITTDSLAKMALNDNVINQVYVSHFVHTPTVIGDLSLSPNASHNVNNEHCNQWRSQKLNRRGANSKITRLGGLRETLDAGRRIDDSGLRIGRTRTPDAGGVDADDGLGDWADTETRGSS